MAKVSIGHRPDMTEEDLLAIFSKGFGQKYEITTTPDLKNELINMKWDFFIKASGWRGIRVGLNQEPEDTKIAFAGAAPSRLAGAAIAFTLGLPSLLLFNGMMNEVKAFVAEEFGSPHQVDV